MSKEELLKPRYKVIADYPMNQRKVGEIILGLDDPEDQKELQRQMNLYTHLFKPLAWWEERKESDMPEYVKHYTGTIMRVPKWQNNEKYKAHFVSGNMVGISAKNCTPATREEYESFLSTQPIKRKG